MPKTSQFSQAPVWASIDDMMRGHFVRPVGVVGDAALAGGAEILVGAHGACGEEDYGGGAEEFRKQFLGEAVQAALPGFAWRDALEPKLIAPRAILLN